jgi:putative membrane protein
MDLVVETVNLLVAMLYTIKNHMRADWGVQLSPGTYLTPDGQAFNHAEYSDLLPPLLHACEDQGLALTLELTVFVEALIAHGAGLGWFHNGAASAMCTSLDRLVDAYGSMEMIRLTPIPVAHLIHHKQALALFCVFLSFAMCSEMGWYAVPLVAFVAFTLYGIEGIAQGLEDPFARAKGDVDLDNVVEDARKEVEVMLDAWRASGRTEGRRCNMFVSEFRRRSRRLIADTEDLMTSFTEADLPV